MGRPAPNFWWDYSEDTKSIIVQSDYASGNSLEVFSITADNAEPQIEKAEKLISDFRSGRKTPKWRKS